MENKNDFIIKKIDLYDFLDILTDLYNRGVDFIDITSSLNNDQYEIGIHFTKEYMANPEELQELEDGIDLEELSNTKLSDEDLNQLV